MPAPTQTLHDPLDSLNTSFARYSSDIGRSRTTGTIQHRPTDNNPGSSSSYSRSPGMNHVSILVYHNDVGSKMDLDLGD